MVREGEKPRRVDATCWSVEVVNGGRGERSSARSETSATLQVLFSPVLTMRPAFSFVFGCSLQVAEKSPFFALNVAPITKYVSGTKAFISRSRSARIRSAGDCTRPAESP